MANAYVGISTSYTPVEYIESSGTQYIDTGFKHNQNTRMIADLSFSDISSWSYPFGSFGGPSGTNKLFCAEINNEFHLGSYFGSPYTTSITASGRHSFDLNKNVHKIDNSTYTFSAVTMQSEYNDLVFGATGYNGNANLPRTKIRLYSFKLYDNGTLIRDFIPVIDQDNVACLYDLVEGNFYYNKGTGTFTAGSATGSSVVAEDKARRIVMGYVGIPTSYTPVEYIESTGIQHIDTNFKPNNNTRVVVDFAPTSVTSEWAWLFGGRNGYHNADYTVAFNTSTWYSGFGGADYRPTPAPTVNARYLVDKNKNTIKINSSSFTNATETFQSNYNLLLLGISDGTAIYHCNAKLYSCKVYDNETLIRDFIPVLDYNNVACLYEQVEGKLYYNKGAGSFTAGSATGQSVLIGNKARKIKKGYVGVGGVARQVFPNYILLNYIESDGNQWVDTGVVYDYATTQFDIDFQYLSSDSGGYISVSWSGSTHDAYVLGSSGTSSSGSIICATAQVDSWTTIATKDANRHQHTYNSVSHQIIYDGRVISGRTTVNVNGVVTMRIFRGPGSSNPAKARIYGYKITNITTGELIRDFIPVLDNLGVPCLYDKVSNTFFYNNGTGTFLYG